ncbi:PREDICTED: disintegrin and metalloproteinase domain-containing protein 20-like, partial [Condylura cristata]|uniref:disintegrin and metalloproteinase domain-containing protein 20-like n=1 Tax=Condylura cristata TaxID=143302 RepID=UPI00064386F3
GGLRGVIQTNDIIYEIEPKEHSTTFEHLVHKLDSEETVPPMRCGLTDEEIARQLQFLEGRDATLMQSGYEGWWTHEQIVEVAVVVDHNRYLHKGSNVSEVYTEVCLVMNYLNGFYIPLKAEVVLISIELHSFAYSIAHELGHNLGMKHDNPLCTCGEKHCIMYPWKVTATKFSNCSYASFRDFIATTTCLRSPPQPDRVFRHKRCGNSVVDYGEECDCGSVMSCEEDPCCQADCTLTPGTECASGLCCHECKLLPSGVLCREPENECDLPEWCNGTSSLCPEDVYVQGGVPCSDSGHCYEKRCNNREVQCRNIFGKEAKSANHRCYREMNTQGDRFGHCGFQGDTYVKCDMADVLCGRVQCDDVTEIPLLSNHTTVHWTRFNEVNCWGTDYHLGISSPDIGEVKDGTECGVDRLCIQRKCVPPTGLRKTCSQETCNKKGICNNRDHCHCQPHWGPPFCLKAGDGGSVVSGPSLRTNWDRKPFLLMVWLFPLFLVSLFLLILLYRTHQKSKKRE